MGIIISDMCTGRELEIEPNTVPEAIAVQESAAEGSIGAYKGPLGSVYYEEEGGRTGTPTIFSDFKDLDEGVRDELTEIEQKVRNLMARAKELLGPELKASMLQV